MFCIGCGKLSALIHCGLCHRQQGVGPITLHDRKEWSSAALCGLNTTLNTVLHNSTLFPFTFPQQIWCSTGLASCLHSSSVGTGLGEVWMPGLTSAPAAPCLLTHSAGVTAGARHNCTLYSRGEGGNLIHQTFVIVFLPQRCTTKNQYFYLVFRSYEVYLFTLVAEEIKETFPAPL